MSVAVITGAGGLVGSEAARYFAGEGLDVIGIDNDMRRYFFGREASTRWQIERLAAELSDQFRHENLDIRDSAAIDGLFAQYGRDIELVIHAAAQPSHDWAATEPLTDFEVNTSGTVNLLEATRRHSSDAVFIFTSTNKVYGDRPNNLPLVELEARWEIPDDHEYAQGIPESMSVDQCLHSLFGASKTAADVFVQEYGRYFGLRTACFRAGCLTGPNHSGAQLHGFLAYLVKCAVTRTKYTVLGYGGKQVRDNIHSSDLIRCFDEFFRAPRVAEVYNIGGGRESNCSILEAIQICQQLTEDSLDWEYSETNRRGDHKWWISDCGKFESHFPDWRLQYDIGEICQEIYEANVERWIGAAVQ